MPLGIPDAGFKNVNDKKADGLVQILLDATKNYSQEYTSDRLFSWHAALFPTGYSGRVKINVAQWRDDKQGPMQVISGPVGKKKVHFEAPSAPLLESEMNVLISWINKKTNMDGIIKAAVCHLWLITIHPFDDGNGGIARTLPRQAEQQHKENCPILHKKVFLSNSLVVDEVQAMILIGVTAGNNFLKILKDRKPNQKNETDFTGYLGGSRWLFRCVSQAL